MISGTRTTIAMRRSDGSMTKTQTDYRNEHTMAAGHEMSFSDVLRLRPLILREYIHPFGPTVVIRYISFIFVRYTVLCNPIVQVAHGKRYD